jgi:hypothetical protein
MGIFDPIIEVDGIMKRDRPLSRGFTMIRFVKMSGGGISSGGQPPPLNTMHQRTFFFAASPKSSRAKTRSPPSLSLAHRTTVAQRLMSSLLPATSPADGHPHAHTKPLGRRRSRPACSGLANPRSTGSRCRLRSSRELT